MLVKKRVVKINQEKKRNFIWYGLRCGFWIMIAVFVVSMLLPNNYSGIFSTILGILILIAIPFTFVVSIIHLVQYRKKALAIVALIISILMGLLMIVGILASMMLAV